MNIYDIVAEAGTSISTVLRVLSNKGGMNPRIRDRVEAVLEKYDYKPSAATRGMASETMKNIAALTVDVRMTHYARTIYVIKQGFSNLGYSVSVCNTDGPIQECSQYFEILPEKQTDGIALIGSMFNELIKYPEITVKIKDTPVVTVNGQVKLPNFYSVLVDDTKAIRTISDYIFDHGCVDLFYAFDIATSSDRAEWQGFLEAVRLRDVSDGDDWVSRDIVATDCDNSPGFRICKPELTTLDNKPKFLGGVCASLLRNRMEGKGSATSVTIQLELVVRGSESF